MRSTTVTRYKVDFRCASARARFVCKRKEQCQRSNGTKRGTTIHPAARMETIPLRPETRKRQHCPRARALSGRQRRPPAHACINFANKRPKNNGYKYPASALPPAPLASALQPGSEAHSSEERARRTHERTSRPPPHKRDNTAGDISYKHTQKNAHTRTQKTPSKCWPKHTEL